MLFQETKLAGAYLIDLEAIADERGFFARVWCRDEMAGAGLVADLDQMSVSFNRRKGTLRGMHLQVPPFEETKLVRCTRGAVFDVIIDLRRDSPSYLGWVGEILSADNRRALYVPAGCAHGFQTLDDNTEVFYQISQKYHPESARGVRYDDPAFGIEWPMDVSVISEKDERWPSLALWERPPGRDPEKA